MDGLFDGRNGAILAYGATGSGKTHTMFGGHMSSQGIVYQAVQDIFDEKEALEDDLHKQVVVKCSFIEIYNENVFDLLVPPKRGGHAASHSISSLSDVNLSGPFRKDSKCTQWVNGRPALQVLDCSSTGGSDGLHIPGLTYAYPESAEAFAQLVEKGRSNRFVACTAANAHSSRSHAIITVEVQVSCGLSTTPGGAGEGTIAKIRMCDLAGSERAASSSNFGIRLREGGNINRSLLALGAVVQSLLVQKKTTQNGAAPFIPYRGSCLTRLLKDSIGGNCSTHMIFCLNPSSKQQEESVNTMLFAMKAREIQAAAQRNVFTVNPEALAQSQKTLIDELRSQITQYQHQLESAGLLRQDSRSRRLDTGSRESSFVPENRLTPFDETKLNSQSDVGVGLIPFVDLTAKQSETTDPDMKRPLTYRKGRSSCSCEVSSPQFAKLEENLKTLILDKEAHYWKNREAKERHIARDLQLRELQWTLARFLASIELGIRIRGTPEVTSSGLFPTPVGVAGMRSTIADIEKQQTDEKTEMDSLIIQMEEVDLKIEKIRSEIPSGNPQSGMVELLFSNMKLRQNCTEAEFLASEFHQECRQTKGRIREYEEALGVCVSALHSVMPHLPHNSTAMADAKLALFYANLPHASTDEMTRVFENSLKADSTPPLVPSAAASPNKHQRSHSGEELMLAIQTLEKSFHSYSPRRMERKNIRNGGSPDSNPDHDHDSYFDDSLERTPPSSQVEAEETSLVSYVADDSDHLKVERKETKISAAPAGAAGRSSSPIAERKPTTAAQPKAEKLAPFSRFYSSNNHLVKPAVPRQNDPPAAAAAATTTANGQPNGTRRRQLGNNNSGSSNSSRTVGETLKPQTPVLTKTVKRPATTPQASPLKRNLKTSKVSGMQEVSPMRATPQTGHQMIDGAKVKGVHLRQVSPVQADSRKGATSTRYGKAPVANSALFQRFASAPVLPRSKMTSLQNPSSPKLQPVSKRIVKKAPAHESKDEREHEGSVFCGLQAVSPGSPGQSPAKGPPGLKRAGMTTTPLMDPPEFILASNSGRSVEDDMEVSRSTCTDIGELSSSLSSFTPRTIH